MLIVSDYSSNEARILETTRMSTGWEPEATADRRARADLSGYRLPPGGLMHPQGGIPFGGSSLKDYGTVDNMRTATLMIEKAAGALAFCSRRLQGNPQLVKFAMQMPDWQDEYERYVSPLMMQTVQDIPCEAVSDPLDPAASCAQKGLEARGPRVHQFGHDVGMPNLARRSEDDYAIPLGVCRAPDPPKIVSMCYILSGTF